MGKVPKKRKPGRPVTVDHTKLPDMRGKTFAAWCGAMGYTDSAAARALDVAPSTIARYRENGAPYMVSLACAALARGLKPWA